MEFFEGMGVALKTERGRRVFPVSDSAQDIKNALDKHAKGAKIIFDDVTELLFDEERVPLSLEEYTELKELALKSAKDFLKLYESIPDKNESAIPMIPQKITFLGPRSRTAWEMYEHTKCVNQYYFGEIGVKADNEGTIFECRKRGFELLEADPNFLNKEVVVGSFDEEWSLRKVLRRFIWHDRIHGKAMYRMAVKTFGALIPDNTFMFNSDQL